MFVSPRRVAKLAAILKPATLLRFHKALVDRKHQRLFSSEGTRRKPGPKGPTAVCRMFNRAIAGHVPPARISTDHDPLFRFHRWLANLRVLDVEEIKSVPSAPMSHQFVERLIRTIRREYLDHTFFWNSIDLHRKLDSFRSYYNGVRVHRSLDGHTPENRAGNPSTSVAKLAHYGWENHCNGLFEIPVAA